MKKIGLILPLLAVVLLAGCTQQESINAPVDTGAGIQARISPKLMAGSGDARNQLLAIVAQATGADNCLTMISGSVYNLTSLITSGDNEILEFCGKDSTELFNSKSAIDPQKWEKLLQLEIAF